MLRLTFSILLLAGFSVAEATRAVVKSSLLHVPGYPYAFNPSVIALKNGSYQLFFRVEGKEVSRINDVTFYNSKIGYVYLDKTFKVKSEPKLIQGLTDFAEDPRAIESNEQVILTYSALIPCQNYARGIYYTRLDAANKSSKPKLYDLQNKMVEKNWIPFTYKDESGIESLNFIYHFSPYKVLHETKVEGELAAYPLETTESYLNHRWSTKWGEIRGGTTLVPYNKTEYLTFFHSMKFDSIKRRFIYYFGAFTIENKPPFRILKMSMTPIKFPDIYKAKRSPTADPNFPFRISYKR